MWWRIGGATQVIDVKGDAGMTRRRHGEEEGREGEREEDYRAQESRPTSSKESHVDSQLCRRSTLLSDSKVSHKLIPKGLSLLLVVKTHKVGQNREQWGDTHYNSRSRRRGGSMSTVTLMNKNP